MVMLLRNVLTYLMFLPGRADSLESIRQAVLEEGRAEVGSGD
jgi:hypothetical protein